MRRSFSGPRNALHQIFKLVGRRPGATLIWMPNRKLWWWVLVGGYLAGLALLGVYFRNALNTDAVPSLRIANYYAVAKLDLAVSGYWAPFLSWLMAPLLKAG